MLLFQKGLYISYMLFFGQCYDDDYADDDAVADVAVSRCFYAAATLFLCC